MRLSFPGLLALSHQHPWLHTIEFIVFFFGGCAGLESVKAFQKGRRQQGWYLATASLSCLFLRNGTQISEWGWTIGMFLALWLIFKTEPKYDIKRYGYSPLAYLLFYWIGLMITAIPITHYWEHHRHYRAELSMLIIGPVLVVIGGVMHWRAWQLPPPPIIQQKEETISETAHR